MVTVKHKFSSAKGDSADASLVRPSNWNDTHDIQQAGQRLLGRSAAGAGATSEVPLGTGLEFAIGNLQVKSSEVLTPANVLAGLGYTPVADNNGKMKGPLIFEDATPGELDFRFRLDANDLFIESTPDQVTWTQVFRFELDTQRLYTNINDLVPSGTVPITGGGTGGNTLALAKANLGIGPIAAGEYKDIFANWNIVARSMGTIYQNTTAKWVPIMVASNSNGPPLQMSPEINFLIPLIFGATNDYHTSAIIPPGYYYKVMHPSVSVLEGR